MHLPTATQYRLVNVNTGVSEEDGENRKTRVKCRRKNRNRTTNMSNLYSKIAPKTGKKNQETLNMPYSQTHSWLNGELSKVQIFMCCKKKERKSI